MAETASSAVIKFKLEAFEGPLDLLLHLIRVNEIDVFDIPIVAITEQYLEHIELMKEINIDVSSEFMVMAATLIHIKTKLMLPQKEDEDDPRAELVERLLEYQQYKEAARVLHARQEEESRTWTRPASITKEYVDVEEEMVEMDIFQLITAFQSVMRSIGKASQMEVEHQQLRVVDKMQDIEKRVKRDKKILFSNIIREAASKRELITIFLAILELVRALKVSALQSKNFGEIVLVPAIKRS